MAYDKSRKRHTSERKVLRVRSGYLIAAETMQNSSNLSKVCSLVVAGKNIEIEMINPYF